MKKILNNLIVDIWDITNVTPLIMQYQVFILLK